MKKKWFYLAACAALVFTAASCSSNDDKEEETPDVPVVGTINLSGAYNVYSHSSYGWVSEDKIGVYVLSDGKSQDNLPYEPSEVTKADTVTNKGMTYINYSKPYATDDIALKPSAQTAAGFKSGKHTIYAYTPYAQASQGYTAVALPHLASQEHEAIDLMSGVGKRKYGFAYASAEVSKYSAATVSLGEFKSVFSMITLVPVGFPDAAVGKTCTKVVVSCDNPIAYEDGATINLATAEISGTPLKSITYTIPEGMSIKSSGKLASPCYIMLGIPYDKAVGYTYTFTYTVDGTEYSTSGKPSAQSKENNLNMRGSLPDIE